MKEKTDFQKLSDNNFPRKRRIKWRKFSQLRDDPTSNWKPMLDASIQATFLPEELLHR